MDTTLVTTFIGCPMVLMYSKLICFLWTISPM